MSLKIPAQGLTAALERARDPNPAVANEGRAEIYRYLDEAFNSYIQRLAARDVRNSIRPSDLFHSVFVLMLDDKMPFKTTCQLRSAFCRSLHNRVVEHLRLRRRQMAAIPADDSLPDQAARSVEEYDDLDWVTWAISRLEQHEQKLEESQSAAASSAKMSDVLRLRFVFDYWIVPSGDELTFISAEDKSAEDKGNDDLRPFREIAAILDVSPGTVFSRYKEAISLIEQWHPNSQEEVIGRESHRSTQHHAR